MVWPLPVLQVQLDIRTGHAQTVEKVLGWLDEEGGVQGTTVCDAGCGTGSLTVPLALRVSCWAVRMEGGQCHGLSAFAAWTECLGA